MNFESFFQLNWRQRSVKPSQRIVCLEGMDRLKRFRFADIKTDSKEVFIGFGSGTIGIYNERTKKWRLIDENLAEEAYKGRHSPFTK